MGKVKGTDDLCCCCFLLPLYGNLESLYNINQTNFYFMKILVYRKWKELSIATIKKATFSTNDFFLIRNKVWLFFETKALDLLQNFCETKISANCSVLLQRSLSLKKRCKPKSRLRLKNCVFFLLLPTTFANFRLVFPQQHNP